MWLFDALGGRIGHFNSVAVPVLNNIFAKIKVLPDENEKKLFTVSLIIAQRSIDMFFKPPQGPVIKDVKQYNRHDFELLYAMFMIWIFFDFSNLGIFQEKDLENKLKDVLPINKDELTNYLRKFKHGVKNPVGLDKLWGEVVKVIHTMPNTQENYLVFARDFSKVCKETAWTLPFLLGSWNLE